jgi:hypothetical protein
MQEIWQEATFIYTASGRILSVGEHVTVVVLTNTCAPVSISSSAEYSVLQALKLREVSFGCILRGAAGITHN